jgi:hypothetical protein
MTSANDDGVPAPVTPAGGGAGALTVPPVKPLGAPLPVGALVENDGVDSAEPPVDPPMVRLRANARADAAARLYCTK